MVYSLGQPFYLNIVRFSNNSNWYPMWYSKWAGSDSRSEAVELRKEAQEYLFQNGSDHWTSKNFRTVKVKLYH